MSIRRLSICLLLAVLFLSRSPLAAEDELPVWTSIGPDGGDVQALAVSPARPNLVLAGVPRGFGIFRSLDRGVSWGAATDAAGRDVRDLAISSNGRAFYAATSRGLLKSMDGGAQWPALDATPDVYTLVATHPRKPAVVFAVRGGELLRSTNGGVTRAVVEGPQGVAQIAFSLIGQRTVIHAAAGNGLWRSTNDGRTWTEAGPSFTAPPRVEAVAVDPADPRIVYIGLRQGRRVLFKSLDGGATWRLSQRGLAAAGAIVPAISELAVDRTNPATVYAVVGGALFRSVNGGRDWSRLAVQPPGGPVNTLEAAGYGLLAGTPAGVLLSADRGSTWQSRVAGLTATAIDDLDIGGQEPAQLYVIARPLGIFKTSSPGRPWLRLVDLSTTAISYQPFVVDPIDPDIVYAGAGGGILKSTDGGQSWTGLISSVCLSFRRIALDPREPAHLFASSYLVNPSCYVGNCLSFRSLDAGATWQCIGDVLNGIYGDAILGVDPNTSHLYADWFYSLARSTDNGTSWTYLSSLPGSGLTFSPLVEGTFWTMQGGGVSRSRDGGQTWEFFSEGLPAGETVVALAPDPADPWLLYAGTRQSGTFKSTDAGETWSPAGIWPAGAVLSGGLLVDPGETAIVYAGTDGLGVLRLDQRTDL